MEEACSHLGKVSICLSYHIAAQILFVYLNTIHNPRYIFWITFTHVFAIFQARSLNQLKPNCSEDSSGAISYFCFSDFGFPHYSIYRKRVKLATSNSENGNDQYCMNAFYCRVWEFIRNTIELGTSQCLKYNCVSENFSVLNNEWFRPQVLGHMVIVFKCIFLAGERLKTACWLWRSWYCFCAWCMHSALCRVGWNWVKLVGGCHNMYQ